MRALHLCEGQRARSTAKWMVFELVDLTHSENVLFIRAIWRKWAAGRVISGCWSVRLQVWHPWLVFKTSLLLRATVIRSSYFVTLAFPNQFRYSVYGQEPGSLRHTHHSVYCGTNIQSGLLRIWNRRYVVNRYIFQLYTAGRFRVSSLYFYISDFSWNCNPSGIYKRGISILA